MDKLQHILELDFEYLETITNKVETPWGYIFYNVDQPHYYDANHAHIQLPVLDSKAIIKEVVQFFKSIHVIPRFYIYDLDKHRQFISELESNLFGFEELINPVQLWDQNHNKKPMMQEVTIERVCQSNFKEALELECSIKEFGGKNVREKAFTEEFNNPAFTHYLLRYQGVASSIACIFENKKQARMESVATLEPYRGKGLIGELIHFIQSEVMNRGLDHLWVFPINETIGQVYEKYGFNTVTSIKMGHAFAGGKSIKEIQGE